MMAQRSHARSARDPAAVQPPAGAESPWVCLRSFVSPHPFVYKRMLGDVDPAARPGDVVCVYDKSGKLVGRGLFNPRSQIAIRMLAAADTPLDDAFWRSRLARAVDLRRALRLEDVTDAYRLVHAEGDGLSGLIAERYGDALVFELFSLGMFQRVSALAGALEDILGAPASLDRPGRAAPRWRRVVRADARIAEWEGFRIGTDLQDTAREPALATIREHGIRYRVDLATGHKTGFFCDQRDNRRRFAEFCRDAAVLDLCCYTGGFGLCARILGAARSVTSVDLDEAALAVARENVNLNQVRNELVHADAFIYVRQMIANRRQFDSVVLDPPKLAASREDVDDALRKYHDLNGLALQVVRPGGILLTCSCSGLVSRNVFLETIQRAGRAVGRTLQVFEQTGAAPDHPVLLSCPESEYLKAVWLRVL